MTSPELLQSIRVAIDDTGGGRRTAKGQLLMKRKTVQKYLDEKITDDEFDLLEMLEEIAGHAVDERKEKLNWQKVAGVAAIIVVLLFATTFGLMIGANEISKETKAVVLGLDHAELTSADGTRIRCASADVSMAADGTTMIRESCNEDGENCTTAAKTQLTKTLVPLIDLPRQSMKFLENMDQVSYTKDGALIMKKLSGYEWYSPSHMELRLAGGDSTLFIKNGTAWIGDKRSCHVQLLQQRRLPSSRRLQGSLGSQAAFTHEELVERYNGEIALLDAQGPWRRLDALDKDGLAGLAEWFGAIFRSDISVIEANEQAMQDYIYNTGCDVGMVPSLPNLGSSGFMRMLISQQFGADADIGDKQLLYFGMKGTPTPKFKLAQRVTLSFDRDSWMADDFTTADANETWPGTIAVTEFRSGEMYDYEVAHPAHPVLRYMAYGIDPRIDAKVAEDKSGLLAAMYVLESSDFDGIKDVCTVRSLKDDSESACSAVALDDAMPFDCDQQLLRWRVDGWILETKLDGEIVGLAAGGGEQRFKVEEVLPEFSRVPFNGCSPSSNAPLVVPEVIPSGDRRLDVAGAVGFPNDTLAGFFARDLAQHQQARSATFWCGSGTGIGSWPCPESITEEMYAAIGRPLGSFEFIPSTHEERIDTERSCMRHDHGAKSTSAAGGAVRSGCDIDLGLVANSANSVVQIMFGHFGIARFFGCWDIGVYKCWAWKWGVLLYGNFCEGEHAKYGPTRMLTYEHSYGWNPQERDPPCTDILPWTTGCIMPECGPLTGLAGMYDMITR
jgi:hypothetical protein